MKDETRDTLPVPDYEIMSLCSGGGCCPEVTVCEDGTVCISDDGKLIRMTYQEARKLCSILQARGYET